jgi:hypothetical protein
MGGEGRTGWRTVRTVVPIALLAAAVIALIFRARSLAEARGPLDGIEPAEIYVERMAELVRRERYCAHDVASPVLAQLQIEAWRIQ